MSVDCILMDFDGTLTDLQPVAAALREAWIGEVAARLCESVGTIARRWAEAERQLAAMPPTHGWEHGGQIVASLRADDYVWNNAVTRRVLREATGRSDVEMAAMAVHRAALERAPAPFRGDAVPVLDALTQAQRPVFVVTNSDGALVDRRLDGLGLRHRDRVVVCGGAAKHVLAEPAQPSDLYSSIPVSMTIAGLDRPVLLRRGRYFDTMRALWSRGGWEPSRTLVCGDIFEIDLALPAALGCLTHLVLRHDTPSHERLAAASVPGGGVGASLSTLLDRAW